MIKMFEDPSFIQQVGDGDISINIQNDPEMDEFINNLFGLDKLKKYEEHYNSAMARTKDHEEGNFGALAKAQTLEGAASLGMKKENRLGRNVLKYKESYWKKINHTNVINISKNKYFSKNFDIFKSEYEKVLKKLNIGQYKINAVRAFLLRYLERLEQYSEIDRQIALEAGIWDSKNVLSRKGT